MGRLIYICVADKYKTGAQMGAAWSLTILLILLRVANKRPCRPQCCRSLPSMLLDGPSGGANKQLHSLFDSYCAPNFKLTICHIAQANARQFWGQKNTLALSLFLSPANFAHSFGRLNCAQSWPLLLAPCGPRPARTCSRGRLCSGERAGEPAPFRRQQEGRAGDGL